MDIHYSCVNCAIQACETGSYDNLPKNCPMIEKEKMESIAAAYLNEDVNEFYCRCTTMEAKGYGQWPRLREIIEFSKMMDYKKIGLAFCGGLRQEAKIVEGILRKHGFEVVSVVCKVGGFDKSKAGMTDEDKIHPGNFEPMCNPIAQAELLNDSGTDFNIELGLCVGHDSIFLANTKAMTTVLATKDRALGNNACAAIYTAHSYCRNKL